MSHSTSKQLIWSLFFWILFAQSLVAQSLSFRFTYHNQIFELGKSYFSESWNDSFTISTLRFYISEIELLNSDKVVYTFPKKHSLVDAETQMNLNLPFQTSRKYDKIRFQIGVDSLSNANAVMSGDLDPIHGMYWTWQSGFIHWKIEGNSPSCPTRNHFFQYHIGGFRSPFQTYKIVELPYSSPNTTITICLDYFFDHLPFSSTYEIMSPNEKAVALAELFKKTFVIRNEK